MNGEDFFIKIAKYMIMIGILLMCVAFIIYGTPSSDSLRYVGMIFIIFISLICFGIFIGELKNPFKTFGRKQNPRK